MNHKDDGSFSGGFAMAFLVVLSLGLGYWIRDQGITFKIQMSPTQTQKR